MKRMIQKFLVGTMALSMAATTLATPISAHASGQLYRSELTNEWISTSIQTQRPIAAMVDNEKIALPHYGLSRADVVYEITNSLKNDGITRFMVIVKDWNSIPQLGSIRSLRPTNLQLAPEWNAVICHDGGPFYNDLFYKNDYINRFNASFSRVKNGKPREFTEYILTGDLQKNFAATKYSTQYNKYYQGPHYKFSSDEAPTNLASVPGSINCNRIDLPYKHNKSTLSYNASTGLYYYSEYGKAHVDPGNNNAQLSFKNLLIQNTTYTALDANGYLMFNSIDAGRSGYFITGGKAIPVTWSKTSELAPTRYYDSTGKEILLNTGKTYVAIVPDDLWTGVKIQ